MALDSVWFKEPIMFGSRNHVEAKHHCMLLNVSEIPTTQKLASGIKHCCLTIQGLPTDT